MNRHLIALAASFAIGAPPLARATAGVTPSLQLTATVGAFTTGEIKKIDLGQGKVTLEHGPIANLGMPGMTMVFKVADAAALARFKPGDRVKFRADHLDGALQVTELLAL